MTEQPRTFTAPVGGRYHFVTGQKPHLAGDCTSSTRCGQTAIQAGEREAIEFVTVPAPEQAGPSCV